MYFRIAAKLTGIFVRLDGLLAAKADPLDDRRLVRDPPHV
jgi:hypothetical protein